MISATLQSFWTSYSLLDEGTRRSARKAYRLWAENPFHPSLHFKCINRDKNIWAVRVSRSYRSIGTLDNDTITWFWIGPHDEYERFFK